MANEIGTIQLSRPGSGSRSQVDWPSGECFTAVFARDVALCQAGSLPGSRIR